MAEIGLVNRGPHRLPQTTAPSCSITPEGVAKLEYLKPTACADPDPWRGCEFTGKRDLSRFAAGHGVLEVRFCIDSDAQPEGGLNLWYEDTSGPREVRKNLVLLTQGEDRLPGCHRMIFRADDAEGPLHCPSRNPYAPRECGSGDPPNGGQGGEGSGGDPPASPGGTGGDAPGGTGGTGGKPYGDTSLVLMSEWCTPEFVATGTSDVVTVSLHSITYYPESCSCNVDAECPSGTSCSRDGWSRYACCECEGNCPGLCE